MADSSSAPLSILERIQTFGERPFLTRGERTFTFIDLHSAFLQAAQQLAHWQVPSGATVVLRGDYGLDTVAFLLALAANGNCIVPLTPMPSAEQAKRIAVAKAHFVIDADSGTVAARPVPAAPAHAHGLLPGHAGLVLFSSGTTAEPKAMLHDLTDLLAAYQHRKPRNLSMLVFLLFDHIGGLNTLFNGMASGTHLIIPLSRDPLHVAELIATHQVRILPVSPTFLNLFLLSGAPAQFDLSSLRIISYGTEPMPLSLLQRVKAAFPRVKLLQTFGTSETGIHQTVSRASDSLEIKFDDPHLEVKVVAGELWLRSATRIRSYLNAPMDRFTEDGWFKTGDQVEQSDDGFLRILGRATDWINVGGEKVMPAEVESVLLAHPMVADATVFSRPHPLTGQVVAARLCVASGTAAPDLAALRRDLKRHCRAALAAFKVPVYFEFSSSPPQTDRIKKARRRTPIED